jgi:putative endonuclease
MMTNKRNTTLYTGVTGYLLERMYQHRSGQVAGFMKKYKLKKLIYFEEFDNPLDAIAREKKLKIGTANGIGLTSKTLKQV